MATQQRMRCDHAGLGEAHASRLWCGQLVQVAMLPWFHSPAVLAVQTRRPCMQCVWVTGGQVLPCETCTLRECMYAAACALP